MNEPVVNTIDDYIRLFPPDVQILLGAMRKVIADNAPGATEKISYGVPTFFLHGNLVHFGAFKGHISFFPGGGNLGDLEAEVAAYRTGKGTLRFASDQPLPLDLVRRIVILRVRQNIEKDRAKKAARKTAPA